LQFESGTVWPGQIKDHSALPLRLDQVQVGHVYIWETSQQDKELTNHKTRK